MGTKAMDHGVLLKRVEMYIAVRALEQYEENNDETTYNEEKVIDELKKKLHKMIMIIETVGDLDV